MTDQSQTARKLSRAERNAMRHLANLQNSWVNPRSIPNGNGHTSSGGANGKMLKSLCEAGLIAWGKAPQHSFYGYRITAAGLAALTEDGING